MKKIIIPISALFVAGLSYAQNTNLSTNENYVYSKTYLHYPEPTDADQTIKTSETVQYLDGLGRPKQVVNIKASPLGRDVVSHIAYDGYGRQALDYLPVPQTGTGNGAIVNDPLANATQTEIYGSEIIFAKKEFDHSPLDRVMEQKQVGTAWSSKPVKFEYDFNADGEVKKYEAAFDYTSSQSSISLSGSYGVGQLYKNTVIDEDGNKTIEFKNSEGQTLLVRKMLDATKSADTYYVYNDYNQLAYVIPPLAVAENAVDEITLNNLCYRYIYDSKNRLVEKKVPGKGWEYMVYDKADRLVATQDANLRLTSKWMVTKYDRFGRVIYTGIMPLPNQTRAGLQNNTNQYVITESRDSTGFTRNGMQIYYTNDLYSQIETVLSVSYYDTYPTGSPAMPAQILGKNVLPQDAQNSNVSSKGMPVAAYVKNIEDDNWTKSYSWYDTQGRPIGSHTVNHLGGYTKTESNLDFSGTPKQVITRHKRLNADNEKVITETFTYDHQNRLKVHKHKIDNNSEEILAQNEYNELSQLKTKKVGGTVLGSGLQTIDYTYNIRGWMTKINDPLNLGTDLFGYKINYNQREGLESPDAFDTNLKVVPKFNGNIAEVSWKTQTEDNEPLKRYGYVYDGLNRLSAGFYQKAGYESSKEYFEKITYDLEGNISRLQRSAGLSAGLTTALAIDNLKYDYEGNKLTKVTEEQIGNSNGYPYLASPNTITYDVNGNMISHKDKGISNIAYNFLNLPNIITANPGTKVARSTQYLYRADGVKVSKIYSQSSGYRVTDYLDGFQYITSPTSANGFGLKFVPTSEGYFDFINNVYIYNYTDHLGNVRLSYSDADQDGVIQPRDLSYRECVDMGEGNVACNDIWIPGEIVETNNYYPFGLMHNFTATTTNAYQYKYNGKELQETGMYDYGARFYMPDIGRWGVVDPLAETSRRFSTYAYALDNPIMFIDPDGREAMLSGSAAQQAFRDFRSSMPPIDYVNEKGKKIGTDGTTDEGVLMIKNKEDQAAIKAAEKKGQNIALNQLIELNSDMVVPPDGTLKESLSVMDRGDANGGFREESSSISGDNVIARGATGPLPTVDVNGTGTAPASIPVNPNTHTTIHLHPAGIFEASGKIYPFDALTPTRGVDDKTFTGKGTNIIVGRLQKYDGTNVIKNSDGTYKDYRDVGAAVYRGNNISKPSMILTKPVIQNILKRNGK